jgi:hypothetical protein
VSLKAGTSLFVIPAQAGIQLDLGLRQRKQMDSSLRWNDGAFELNPNSDL